MTGSNAIIDHVFSTEFAYLNNKYEEVRCLEPLITGDLQECVHEKGTSMKGLEFSAKTTSSIEDKIRREVKKNPNTLPNEYISRMKDIIRYTEIDNYQNLIASTQETIKKLEERGYVLSGVKNYYANPYPITAYMGIHLNFISPFGQEIEYQMHSEESFRAKQEGHALYEQIRASVLNKDKDELIKKIVEIHSHVPIPPKYETLEDYAMDPVAKQTLIDFRKDKLDVAIDVDGENPRNLMYNVFYDGQRLLNGFEHSFSDGSIWVYRNNEKNKTSFLYSLTEKREEIARNKIKFHPLNIKQINKMAQIQEKEHAEWCAKNLPNNDHEIAISELWQKHHNHNKDKTQSDFFH